MTPKLYKAADVCEIAQLQPYVLRSWEKEFPGIGVQKSDDSPRFYRQSDLDQVLRIKQLVFGEGLTLAGARRKLEESMPAGTSAAADASEVIEVLGADAHKRIAHVRDGLRSLLHLLNGAGMDGEGAESYELTPPPAPGSASRKIVAARGKTPAAPRKVVAARTAKRVTRAR
jgi:DNA-binding transcriptional MerR regulator